MENSKQTEKIISHLASFPELNPNPVLEIDYSGRISYCNFAALETLKEIGLKGKDIRGFVPKDLKRIIKSLRKNKRPLSYEVEIADKAFIGNISLSSEFKTAHIYLTDITERKYTEDALRREKDMVRRYLDIAGVIIVAIDASQKIRLINRKGCEILGVSQKEAVGRNWFNSFIPRKNRKETRAVFFKLISGKLAPVEYFENPVLTKSGEERIIAWHNNMLRDARGKIIATLSSGEDITERKKAEEELRESEVKFRLAFENAQDAMLWADIETGVLIYCNKAAQRLFEKPKSQIIGQHQTTLHPPEAQKYCREVFKKQALGTGSGAEIPIITKSGKIKTVTIASSVVQIKGRKIIQGIFRDVTERNKAEDNLRKLNRTLKALSDSNQVLIGATNESEYLREICRIVVEDCGHYLVWIGFAENDENKSVRPVAQAGFERGYLNTLNITWADTERGRGPTGTAIRKGKPSICKNMLTDPKFKPWRKEATKRGYASSVVLPLIANNKAFGAINIYSKEPDPFTEDEVKLLAELADDLAYGITAIRLRIAHKQAEEALKRAKDELEFKVAQRTIELVEANRHTVTRNVILTLIGKAFSRKEYLDSLVGYLKIWSGCRCVGIRVLDAEGRIPYESYTGFSREFRESENWLSIKEDQCSCIRVIKGKPEFQDMPVTSKGGSFYSNNTMKFMENLSEKESSRFRGVCVRTGFLSVAVIPISYKNKIIGVIHLADEKEGKVQLKTVELMEFLAPLIGEGINKFNLEDRIKQGHSILDASFKHAINPFVFLDTGFNFIRVNEAYARACRRDVSEFPGHNLFEFYPNEENERIFRQVVRTKAHFQAFAKPFTFSDHPEWGVTYWDWTLVSILDNKRMVEFLVFSLNDVTKRKLAEEKLSQTQKELDSAKRLSDIGILAATVAHELRNPLGVIRTAAYNIKRKAQNPALESHLINIEKKILESDQIINNLLFYSRLKSPHYESVRIYDILNECVKSTIIRFSKHNVAVIKKINSLRKVFIDADPLQMSELINNILNNANDACIGRNCKIEVRAVKDGKGNVEIVFRDYGVGIDEENLKKIFKPFFTTKAKGTGLGLTVCNQIVNLHGGKICIDSKKGRGTTVTVTVPIKRKINSKESLND